MGKLFILICFLLSTATTHADTDTDKYWLDLQKERNGKFTNEMCAKIYQNGWQSYLKYFEQKGHVELNETKIFSNACEEKNTKKCKDLRLFLKNNKYWMKKAERKMINSATVYNSFCK
jgi:hypothetical protein